MPLSLIVDPITFVDVSVRVVELSSPVRFVILPLTLVFSTIRPQLHSDSVPVETLPLAAVDGSILEAEVGPVLDRLS